VRVSASSIPRLSSPAQPPPRNQTARPSPTTLHPIRIDSHIYPRLFIVFASLRSPIPSDSTYTNSFFELTICTSIVSIFCAPRRVIRITLHGPAPRFLFIRVLRVEPSRSNVLCVSTPVRSTTIHSVGSCSLNNQRKSCTEPNLIRGFQNPLRSLIVGGSVSHKRGSHQSRLGANVCGTPII